MLLRVKSETGCTAVCSGAIFSTYQKNRVEKVCERLGLLSIAPLWRRDQDPLLSEMIDSGFTIRIIKVASIGLGREHLGKTADELIGHFREINKKFGFNVCGEGGEYESLVTDCPIFSHRLVLGGVKQVCHSPDDMAPVWYETFESVDVMEKSGVKEVSLSERAGA